MNYWKECVQSALEEAGLIATPEQVNIMADVVRGGHETHGMSYPAPENPLIAEVSTLKKKLAREEDKITCTKCNGTGGWTVGIGNSHQAYERCWKCHGKGRVDP